MQHTLSLHLRIPTVGGCISVEIDFLMPLSFPSVAPRPNAPSPCGTTNPLLCMASISTSEAHAVLGDMLGGGADPNEAALSVRGTPILATLLPGSDNSLVSMTVSLVQTLPLRLRD